MKELKKVNIYKAKSISEVKKDSFIEITDKQAINQLRKAFNHAKNQSGIVNMADPQYKVKIGEKSYFLWISDKSGTIMKIEDTHTIYLLSNESTKLITSKFNE